MSETTGIRSLIKFVVDKTGISKAVAGIEDIVRASGRAGKSFFNLNRIVKDAVKSFGALFALDAIRSFVTSAIVDIAKLQRSLSATSLKMQQLGMNASRELPRVREILQELQDSGGPLVKDTIPAFGHFVSMTKDVSTALAAVKLAADISESGIADMGASVDIVSNILQGRARDAAKTLGIEFVKLTGEQKTNAEVMREAIDLYGGMADRTDDAQDALDRTANAWQSIKTSLGEVLAPLASVTAEFAQLWAAVNKFSSQGFKTLFGSLIDLRRTIGDMFGLSGVAGGQAGDAGLIAQAGRKDVEEERDRLVRLVTEEIALGKKELEESQRNAREKERIRKDEEDSRRRAIENERQQMIDLQRELVAATHAGSSERLAATLELLAAEEKHELQQQELTEAAKEAIRAKYRSIRGREEADFFDDQLASLNAFVEKLIEERQAVDVLMGSIDRDVLALDAQHAEERAEAARQAATWVRDFEVGLEIEAIEAKAALQIAELEERKRRDLETAGLTGEERSRIERRYAAESKSIEQATATAKVRIHNIAEMAKLNAVRYVANSVASINTAVFGNNKNIAIAASIVDTIAASVEAFRNGGGWPTGLIPMAVTLAMGYAKVKAIRNTNPEVKRGFDDPRNDAVAMAGGFRWARDMVQNWETGVRRLWNQDMDRAVPKSQTLGFGQPQEVHYHGTVIDTFQAARRLSRLIERVGRADHRARFVK